MISSFVACEHSGLQLVFVHLDHRFSGFLFMPDAVRVGVPPLLFFVGQNFKTSLDCNDSLLVVNIMNRPNSSKLRY